jgi:hypothetical protein
LTLQIVKELLHRSALLNNKISLVKVIQHHFVPTLLSVDVTGVRSLKITTAINYLKYECVGFLIELTLELFLWALFLVSWNVKELVQNLTL